MGRIDRIVLSSVAAGLLVAVTLPASVAADDGSGDVTDADRELAERHVPVMMLQTQPDECSPDGEPFLPMPVDAVLDNPEVALRQLGPDGLVVTWAPTAADLHAYGPSFYLDFPGAALAPGCSYERDMRRYLGDGDLAPTVYAHIARSPDEPGVIALQYWFYWYYNDWNNKHESDWEGIQLLFRASSAEEALALEPYSVGYAQHTGGERADWDDDKLERDGLRPVVYTSARSHASYFSSEIYLGRGASEGFGCDDTTGPSTRVDPIVVPLPARVDDPDDPLAWLEFEGRWGERHGGAYDSPTGLRSKARWNDPLAWHAGLRDGSVVVPAGESAAGEVIDAFCDVVQWGSGQALLVQLSPLRVLITIVVGVSAVRFLLGRTSWRTVPTSPITRRRRGGEIGRAAIARFRHAPITFLGLGVLAIPVVVVAGAVVGLARAVPLLGDLLQLSDTGRGSRLVLSVVTSGIASGIAFAFVVAAVSFVLDRADRGSETTLGDAVAAVRARAPRLAGVVAIVFVAVASMTSTVLLAPVAIWLLVRWQLAAPALMIEQRSSSGSLMRSMQLTRRRWWHTLVVTAFINLAVLGSGVVVGLVVLTVFSSLPLWSLTVVVTAVGAFVMPIGAIALTLLYGDARSQADERSAPDAPEALTAAAASPSR